MNRQWLIRWSIVMVVSALGGLAMSACTVVKYADDPDGGGGGTGPGFASIDVLVLTDLNRSTSNLTPKYGEILGGILSGLQDQNIDVRRAAMAPLHRRTGQVVPLIYGEGDDGAEFDNFAQAIAFFAQDDGLAYLPDTSTGEAENLALLGGQLAERAIYHPTTADPTGEAYFGPPADGFLVVILSSSERLCGLGDAACTIDGTEPADYFTQTDADGVAWMNLPGGGSLPASRVLIAPIVTAENAEYSEFYESCTQLPNFPASLIDVMEPSPTSFWEPFVEGIEDSGGQAEFVDMCEAMSSRGPTEVGRIVGRVRVML